MSKSTTPTSTDLGSLSHFSSFIFLESKMQFHSEKKKEKPSKRKQKDISMQKRSKLGTHFHKTQTTKEAELDSVFECLNENLWKDLDEMTLITPSCSESKKDPQLQVIKEPTVSHEQKDFKMSMVNLQEIIEPQVHKSQQQLLDDEFEIIQFSFKNTGIEMDSKQVQEGELGSGIPEKDLEIDKNQLESIEKIKKTKESENQTINIKRGLKSKQSKKQIKQDRMLHKQLKSQSTPSDERISEDNNSLELDESQIFHTLTKLHHRTGKPLYIKHLNLHDFKRIECPKKNAPHNHKSCYYYHSIKDKRRDDDYYTPELCKFAETEKCPKKDKCRRAHNRVERLYHKDKYKTKFCHFFPNKIQQCEYGDYCSFAHSVEDIKVRLIHHLLPQNQDFDFYIFYFKTEWCPYNHEHNKAQCVYAHNFQDFRRKPNLFRYDTELCEDWQSGTFITCYEEGCKRLQKCTFSHGWKEQQFHPLVYKTQPCEEPKCFKGFECPFFHSTKDRRVIEARKEKEMDQLFVPKERSFKCSQQPNLMELYFDNNLNHMKEYEIAKEAQSQSHQTRKVTERRIKDTSRELSEQLPEETESSDEREEGSKTGQSRRSKKSVKELTTKQSIGDQTQERQISSVLQPQESKSTSQSKIQRCPSDDVRAPNFSKPFLPLNHSSYQHQQHGLQIDPKNQHLHPGTPIQYSSTSLGNLYQSQHQNIIDLNPNYQNAQQQQASYQNVPPMYQSPQHFTGAQNAASKTKSQQIFLPTQNTHIPHQQQFIQQNLNRQAQSFYPQQHQINQINQQATLQQHPTTFQTQSLNYHTFMTPPHHQVHQGYGFQSQQHTPQSQPQQYYTQQSHLMRQTNPQQLQHSYTSIQNRQLPQMVQLHKSFTNPWLEEQQHKNKYQSYQNQDLLFTSQQNQLLLDQNDYQADYYTPTSQCQRPQFSKKLNYRQTPISMAVTAVEEQKKQSQSSVESESLDSQEEDPVSFKGGIWSNEIGMKSCPLKYQSVNPMGLTDTFYQEKLNNFAESYKKLNFNDIEEEDFEAEISKIPFNMLTRSALDEQIEEDDASKSPYSNQVINLFSKSFQGISLEQQQQQQEYEQNKILQQQMNLQQQTQRNLMPINKQFITTQQNNTMSPPLYQNLQKEQSTPCKENI